MARLQIKPIELSHANKFIAQYHRHSPAVTGHRWSQACWAGDRLCGVIVVGRPVARNIDQREIVEVLRNCTDGTKHAASKLYAAAARAAREIGYREILTYVLESESAVTLRAAGWMLDLATAGGGDGWAKRYGGTLPLLGDLDPKKRPTCTKQRWHKVLNSQGGADG